MPKKKDLHEKEEGLTVSVGMRIKDIAPIVILRDLLKLSKNYKGKMQLAQMNVEIVDTESKQKEESGNGGL